MGKRGHWQGYLTAEDGSLLRVVGSGKPVIRPRNTVDTEPHVRRMMAAKQRREDEREWQRERRALLGFTK